MKAARLVGPRRFEFEDVEMAPDPRPGEVLIRNEYFSVCGSDLRTYDRVLKEEEYPLGPGAPCHEQAGGLKEYTTIAGFRAVPVPMDDDGSQWVLCQPVGTVLFAVTQIGHLLGKRAVVVGQGPIGLSFTDFLVRGGCRDVIVVDKLDYRLDIARKLGATHTLNPTRDNVVEAIAEITKGQMADVAVEAVGRPETVTQVFQAIKMKGTVIVFGIAHDEDEFMFNWNAMSDKLPRIIVTNSARGGEMPDTVDHTVSLVTQGRLNLDHLLTHRMGWEQVGEAYETYSAKKDNSLKIVMKR